MEAEKDAPGAAEAPVVVLYMQTFADVGVKQTKVCRNLILSVKDPSVLPERALHPCTPVSPGRRSRPGTSSGAMVTGTVSS